MNSQLNSLTMRPAQFSSAPVPVAKPSGDLLAPVLKSLLDVRAPHTRPAR